MIRLLTMAILPLAPALVAAEGEPPLPYAITYELVDAHEPVRGAERDVTVRGGLMTYAQLCEDSVIFANGQSHFEWDGEQHVHGGHSETFVTGVARKGEFGLVYPSHAASLEQRSTVLRFEGSDLLGAKVSTFPALFLTARWEGARVVMPDELWSEAEKAEGPSPSLVEETLRTNRDNGPDQLLSRIIEAESGRPLSLRTQSISGVHVITHDFEFHDSFDWNGLWIPRTVVEEGLSNDKLMHRHRFEFRDLVTDREEIVERFLPIEDDQTISEWQPGARDAETMTRPAMSREELLELFCGPAEEPTER